MLQRLLKTKIQLPELEVSEAQTAAISEGIPGEIPQHVDPTLILFHRHCSKLTGGSKMPDYLDLWCDHFCVLTSTFNLLAWEVLLPYLLQNEIHLFDKLGKY